MMLLLNRCSKIKKEMEGWKRSLTVFVANLILDKFLTKVCERYDSHLQLPTNLLFIFSSISAIVVCYSTNHAAGCWSIKVADVVWELLRAFSIAGYMSVVDFL